MWGGIRLGPVLSPAATEEGALQSSSEKHCYRQSQTSEQSRSAGSEPVTDSENGAQADPFVYVPTQGVSGGILGYPEFKGLGSN